MAKPVSTATSSIAQTLKRYLKKPWEITGPCADPEYKLAVPGALEYRLECPASTQVKACVPTSNPETVYDIKYYARDQRRNRPPIRRTVLKKADVEKLMKEKKTFDKTATPEAEATRNELGLWRCVKMSVLQSFVPLFCSVTKEALQHWLTTPGALVAE
ncbi:hypothetical protein L3X38_029641 [Prunus dulcis]|uniref:Uncharacterized protein n=1 Tax=Prunus dulcis TaxID=3755 RepID=A0AAD4VS90_PRUDU|nr:hypothetical protein L3X38_029641 [Prunus dulcis]